MILEVDSRGFAINNKRYNAGDVLCYPNPNIKGIILFGFYDNRLCYEDHDYGCGFYIIHCIRKDEKWEKDISTVASISVNFDENKETDLDTIKEIRIVSGFHANQLI